MTTLLASSRIGSTNDQRNKRRVPNEIRDKIGQLLAEPTEMPLSEEVVLAENSTVQTTLDDARAWLANELDLGPDDWSALVRMLANKALHADNRDLQADEQLPPSSVPPLKPETLSRQPLHPTGDRLERWR